MVSPWVLIYESSKTPTNKLQNFSEIFKVKNNILCIDWKSIGVNFIGIKIKFANDIALDSGSISSK